MSQADQSCGSCESAAPLEVHVDEAGHCYGTCTHCGRQQLVRCPEGVHRPPAPAEDPSWTDEAQRFHTYGEQGDWADGRG